MLIGAQKFGPPKRRADKTEIQGRGRVAMIVGVVSDTHNQADRLARAVSMLQERGATHFLHAGDITSPSTLTPLYPFEAWIVLGNNDKESDYLAQTIRQNPKWHLVGDGATFTFADRTVALTHGHLPKVARCLLDAEPDYLIMGHSHKTRDERSGKTRILNPGALHQAKPWTVGCLDLAMDQWDVLVVDGD